MKYKTISIKGNYHDLVELLNENRTLQDYELINYETIGEKVEGILKYPEPKETKTVGWEEYKV